MEFCHIVHPVHAAIMNTDDLHENCLIQDLCLQCRSCCKGEEIAEEQVWKYLPDRVGRVW